MRKPADGLAYALAIARKHRVSYELLRQRITAADLELPTLLNAMSGGDKFLRETSEKVLLTSLREPEAIRYRQNVLADCIAEPETIRDIYRLAVATLQEKRRAWGIRSTQNPSSILSAAVSQLEVFIAGLRRLRQIAPTD